jgi:hypothetical protein
MYGRGIRRHQKWRLTEATVENMIRYHKVGDADDDRPKRGRMNKGCLVALTALIALAATAGVRAIATPPFTVVMTGLDNPRGLAWGPEGALYVAEAGRGGTQPCYPGPEGGQQFAGFTGAVSRLWHGVQERVATNLPSVANATGMAALGPHNIDMLGRGTARVTIGLGSNPANRAICGTVGPYLGWITRVLPNGQWRLETDLANYEAENNPDGGVPDSNPYGLLAEPGAVIATDAGGNDLLRIAANGSISTIAVFPARFNSTRGTDAVPTSVAIGPDGAYYVGELTGVPFTPGAANVWRVVPGEAPTAFRSGFTDIIDIAFGSDGSLYVLEFATGPFLAPPGDLWRVAPNGARTLVATGLFAPGSVTIGPDGAFYISNCSIFPSTLPSPCGQGGQVVRIPG